MNEEEIIKNIEDMLLHAETNLLDYEALAIQGLLDLYIAEKQKDKKLEDKIKGKIKELNELLKETQKELGSASIEFNIYAHQKDILNCLLEE